MSSLNTSSMIGIKEDEMRRFIQFLFDMECFTLIVLCVGAVFLSVIGNVNGDSDGDFDQILSKTKEVLIKYNQDLDDAVPFKELKESLKALDFMARNYHGNCREEIYEATSLGYNATTKYFQATDIIYAWCVKARMHFGFIIEENPHRKEAVKAIHKMIKKGLEAIKNSLSKLEEVRNELLVMGDKLRPVPGNLTIELDTLRQEHSTHVRPSAKWSLKKLWELIGKVVSIVQSFLMGILEKIGETLGMKDKMIQLGIPLPVIEGKKAPNDNEKWKMTEAYYTSLIQAVNYAQDNVTAAWNAMNTEITQVGALHGSVEGYWDIIEDFPRVAENTQTQLTELRDILTAFITRHGGDKSKSRKKREVIRYRGLDVERISEEVDSYLKATVNEREAAFWTVQTLPEIQNYLIGDLSKFFF